jgi:flagellar biosynthesis protein FlhF
MKIRRFFAPDIRQAMRLVREAQGPDAVILSNRKVEGGVEIVAAVDFDETLFSPSAARNAPAGTVPEATPVPQPPPERAPGGAQPAGATKFQDTAAPKPPAAAPSAMLKPVPAAAPTTPAARLGVPAYDPPESHPAPVSPGWIDEGSGNSRPRNDDRTTADAPRTPRATDILWAQDPVLVDMRRELKELRGLLEHQLCGLAWAEMTRRTPVQARLLRALTELGLAASLSRELAGAVAGVGEFDTAWRHAMGLLAERLTVVEDVILTQGGVVALVGATGVGKTTTVAKLAAHYALRHGREQVALVTTDGYRIGAQEQLRTFARILGVPMRMVADAAELSETLAGLADCGLVLIDTAGMSQRDLRLSEQFATLRGARTEVRSYLVLSAITQRVGLEEVVRAFAAVDLAGCILTKLDEAASLGEALSVVVRHRLPIAYLGVGQRVPEDLLPARAHNLVSRAVALLQHHAPEVEEETLALAFGGNSHHASL